MHLLVDYSSQRAFTQKGVVTVKSTSVRCNVLGTIEKDRLAVKIDSAVIKSYVYADDVQKDLRESSDNRSIPYRLQAAIRQSTRP